MWCGVVLCHVMWNDRDGVFVASGTRGRFFLCDEVLASADFSSAEPGQGGDEWWWTAVLG